MSKAIATKYYATEGRRGWDTPATRRDAEIAVRFLADRVREISHPAGMAMLGALTTPLDAPGATLKRWIERQGQGAEISTAQVNVASLTTDGETVPRYSFAWIPGARTIVEIRATSYSLQGIAHDEASARYYDGAIVLSVSPSRIVFATPWSDDGTRMQVTMHAIAD